MDATVFEYGKDVCVLRSKKGFIKYCLQPLTLWGGTSQVAFLLFSLRNRRSRPENAVASRVLSGCLYEC